MARSSTFVKRILWSRFAAQLYLQYHHVRRLGSSGDSANSYPAEFTSLPLEFQSLLWPFDNRHHFSRFPRFSLRERTQNVHAAGGFAVEINSIPRNGSHVAAPSHISAAAAIQHVLEFRRKKNHNTASRQQQKQQR